MSVCAFAAVLLFFFAAREALIVKTVSVEGAKAVSERSVLKRLGLAPDGKTLLLPGAAARALEQELWVKKVSVKRDFRGGISITLEEKVPFCMFAAPDGVLFYIDSHGGFLGRAPVSAYGMDFPVIRSPVRFIGEGVLALGLSASAKEAPGWEDISEVVVSGGDGVEIFTRQGGRIELGVDLRAGWERLEKITRSLYASGLRAEYINLRLGGVGILGLKEGRK